MYIRDCGHHAGCNRHWWIYWGNPRGLQFTNDFDVRFAYAAMSSGNQFFGRGNQFMYKSLFFRYYESFANIILAKYCYKRISLRWIPTWSFSFLIKTNPPFLFFIKKRFDFFKISFGKAIYLYVYASHISKYYMLQIFMYTLPIIN